MKHSRTTTASLLLTTLLLISTLTLAGTKGMAYVSNQDGGVTVIDLETMETTNTLDIQAKGPRGIGVTKDGKLLVTANKDDDNISVVELATGNVTKIAIGKNPEFVRVYGSKAYVTYEPSPSTGGANAVAADAQKEDDSDREPGHIAIVDLKTGKVVKDITGKPETEGLEFSPNGKKLIVTNESDNSITVHDMKSGKLLKNIPVASFGDRPRGIKVAPNGNLYVSTLEFSDKLLVLDKNLKPLKTIDTGKSPYGVSFDKDSKRIFVAASKDKVLQVFDANTLEKIKDIPTGSRCWHFTFTPDNQNIMLACGRSDEVVVVDVNTLEVTKRIGDKELPWGIVTFPKSLGSLDRP